MMDEDYGPGFDPRDAEDDHRADMAQLGREEDAAEARSNIRKEAAENVAAILAIPLSEVPEVLVDAEETILWDELDEG